MPTTDSVPLPERPNVEQLKKQARDLQRGVRRGDPDALRYARLASPDPQYRLAAAQLALARLFGFGSWPRLRRHVAEIEAHTWTWSSPTDDEPVAHRVLRLTTVSYDENAHPDVAAARQLLDAEPDLPSRNLAVAAVCGDSESVSALLADGTAVDAPDGPFGWPALMYLAYSRLDVGEAATLQCVRLLLEAGADPNDGRYFLGYPTPFTILTGVFGDGERGQPAHPYALPLARVLLEAGADPNDGQTLYNRMFEDEDDFLDLLFEFGLGTGDGGPWWRRLPDLSDSPSTMLRGLLDWAVSHGQRDRVALLVEHGVDVLSPDPTDGRTPIAVALVNGHRDVATVLRSAGASEPDRSPDEAYAGAVLAGDRDAVSATDPAVVARVRRDRPGLVVWAASQGRLVGVELLADAGFDLDALARGDVPVEQPWQTALHSAVEHDHREVVELLLRRGVRRDIRDARFDGTAADWARHFGRPHLEALLEG